jgi:predicted 3-demethylubiquinone-9 3-methyltransferase (glyoxalase superfamily)
MFTGQAEEAVNFYVSTFLEAEILHIDRYGVLSMCGHATLR